MLKLIALWFTLIAWAQPDATTDDHHRLFRLVYQGHISHLLVTPGFNLDPNHNEVKAAFATLDNACEVILMGASALEKAGVDGKPIVLADHLSLPARETLRELGLAMLLNREEPVTINHVWRRARHAFDELRDKRIHEYAEMIRAGGAMDNDFEIEPNLHLVANFFFTGHQSNHDLILRAERWGVGLIEQAVVRGEPVEAAAEGNIDFMHEAYDRADDRGINVTFLDALTPGPTEPPNLEKVLGAMKLLVLHERPVDAYVNNIVAEFLEAELSRRYFEMSPRDFSMARASMLYSGLYKNSRWSGEENLTRYETNLHEHWVGPILNAMAKPPVPRTKTSAFIVVDAKHVLPNIVPDRRRSLLELLEEKGVEVTPVTQLQRPRRIK